MSEIKLEDCDIKTLDWSKLTPDHIVFIGVDVENIPTGGVRQALNDIWGKSRDVFSPARVIVYSNNYDIKIKEVKDILEAENNAPVFSNN